MLIWHVATEICYFTTGQPADEKKESNKKLCRNISEYLVYFLVMEGKLTSTVPGNIGLRFKDICWEEVQHTINEIVEGLSKTTFRRHRLMDQINSITSAKLSDFKDAPITLANRNRNTNTEERTRLEKLKIKWEDKKRGEVCERLLQLKWKGDTSSDDDYAKSSKLSEAIKLAKDLRAWCGQDREGPNNPAANNNNNNVQNEQDVENQGSNGQDNHGSEEELWEALSHVWIGLLLYGASHCRDDVQYLNKGGELLTFVRLLMVHFGLRDAFKDEGCAGGFKLAAELQKVIKDEKLQKIISEFLP